MSDPGNPTNLPKKIYGLQRAEEALLAAFIPDIPDAPLDEIEIDFIRNRVQHELLALAFNMLNHMPAVMEFIATHRMELREKEETDGARPD